MIFSHLMLVPLRVIMDNLMQMFRYLPRPMHLFYRLRLKMMHMLMLLHMLMHMLMLMIL